MINGVPGSILSSIASTVAKDAADTASLNCMARRVRNLLLPSTTATVGRSSYRSTKFSVAVSLLTYAYGVRGPWKRLPGFTGGTGIGWFPGGTKVRYTLPAMEILAAASGGTAKVMSPLPTVGVAEAVVSPGWGAGVLPMARTLTFWNR